MAKTFSWRQEPELMARLRNAQNDPANENQDIMTIVGFFESREELERHVRRYELKALVEA
jgi:hypothetical protein